jgi:hypothetical protein
MKFKLTTQDNVSFTSLQGYVSSTRRQLVAVFGEPRPVESLDGKITTEWMLEFADKTIATVYDWKRYELGAPSDDEVYDWHIGGYNYKAVVRVCDEIQETLVEI